MTTRSALSWLPLGAALAILAPPWQPLAAKPAVPLKAIVQQILDGAEFYIDARQAKVKQQARPPQLISTGQSRGQLGFSSGAVARVNHDSELRLGSDCFLLQQGEVLVSGKQAGCTRSVRLSVRGTNYVLGLNAAGETALSVLEGVVGLERQSPSQVGNDAALEVRSGQRLELSRSGEVLSLSRLQQSDYAALLQGPLFAGFAGLLPQQPLLDRYLQQTYPELLRPQRSKAGSDSVARLRRMLDQVKQINRDLDRRAGVPTRPSAPEPDQPAADPRMAGWKQSGSCYGDVQAYTASLARVYRDWAAPKPSRKGRFVTRVDFDVYTDGRPASGFEITQPSGEQPQDRSAYGEAVRKSRELSPPPACVGDKLRVYHQFIVEYD